MRIFHVALAAEWEAALESGAYTMSTLGRTLAEEGFIHCSHEDQCSRSAATTTPTRRHRWSCS